MATLETDWAAWNRKCCKDNRMCPGSAAEGRRIPGSYCTLWNGFWNARCLTFFLFFVFYFSAALSHITRWRRRALKIIKFLWTREWHMECFWSLTSEFSCISHHRQMIGKKNKKHPNSFSDQQLATETDVRWTQSSRYNKQ